MELPSRTRLLLIVLAAALIGSWGWVAPTDQLFIGYAVLVVAACISLGLMARQTRTGETGPDGDGGPGDDGPDEREPFGDGPDARDLELWEMIDGEQSEAGGPV